MLNYNKAQSKLPEYRPQSQTSSKKFSWSKLIAISLLVMFSIAFTARRSLTGFRIPTTFPSLGCGLHTQKQLGGLPTHYTLPSGSQIPSVALGVWQAPKDQVGEAVKTAVKAGYTHIDGAWIYRNEKEVGDALKESGIKREDIWLTSKVRCLDSQ